MNGLIVPTPRIAYFSMEICLDQAIPTYSGGLGVLAGDTLRSAADLNLPVVGVTLLHRKGYFRQQIDENGGYTGARGGASIRSEERTRAMKPFVINRHGRLVFPSNFSPDLDFTVFQTLEQFEALKEGSLKSLHF